MSTASRRAAAYVRISDDRDGQEQGVGRQEADCRELAARLGWEIVEVYAENDTSAFKRRTVRLPDGSTAQRVVRPEFRRLLGDLGSGAVDGLIAYDLDRVARDPRDLEDLIDVVRMNQVPTRSVTGSLDDLMSDNGITMARFAVTIANKSSMDTSRRVARKHEQLAEQGKWGGGGRRRYGYADDRVTIREDEAAIVREIADLILGNEEEGREGMSLRGIAQLLNERKVPTALDNRKEDGNPKGWSTRSVHSVVTKPHVAGLRSFRGEVVGEANWPAILDRDTWDRVKIKLEARAHGSNNRFKRWLTGVLLCGQCGRALYGWASPNGDGKRYWCATPRDGCGRTAIQATPAEDTVKQMIFRYLARPDIAASLAEATSASSVASARVEAKADQEQLKELAGMWARKEITMPEYLAARREIEERLGRWRGILKAAVPGVVRGILAAESVPAGWERLDPAGKRDVARVLYPHGIEVIPPTIRYAFDPNRLNPLKHPRKTDG